MTHLTNITPSCAPFRGDGSWHAIYMTEKGLDFCREDAGDDDATRVLAGHDHLGDDAGNKTEYDPCNDSHVAAPCVIVNNLAAEIIRRQS